MSEYKRGGGATGGWLGAAIAVVGLAIMVAAAAALVPMSARIG